MIMNVHVLFLLDTLLIYPGPRSEPVAKPREEHHVPAELFRKQRHPELRDHELFA